MRSTAVRPTAQPLEKVKVGAPTIFQRQRVVVEQVRDQRRVACQRELVGDQLAVLPYAYDVGEQQEGHRGVMGV
jgi:hypothetical protein